MHTRSGPGVDADLVERLEKSFSFVAPLAPNIDYLDAPLDGLESISMDELEDAFKVVEKEAEAAEMDMSMDVDRKEVLEGHVFDFAELKNVDKGLIPTPYQQQVRPMGADSVEGSSWNVDDVLRSHGIVS